MTSDAIWPYAQDSFASFDFVESPVVGIVNQVTVKEFFGEGQGSLVQLPYAVEGLQSGAVIEGVIL